MATKQLYATGSFKYQHRMLKAGDPVEMDAPTARLYEHLGKVSEAKPTTKISIDKDALGGADPNSVRRIQAQLDKADAEAVRARSPRKRKAAAKKK